MRHHGPDARAIVWEHNTHVGDARATDMADEGMVNVGQLVREWHSDEGVVLVGFGSHRGTVIAGLFITFPVQFVPEREMHALAQLAVGAAQLMRQLLFGVVAWDAPTLVIVAAVLAFSALLASWIPARRAASVNPIEVLRAD